MHIQLYQIDPFLDTEQLAFLPLSSIQHVDGVPLIRPEIYRRVLETDLPCDTPEEVYAHFDRVLSDCSPALTLSVSDILRVTESRKTEPGFYYCDKYGFEQVPFDPDRVPRKIRVVMVEPGKLARTAEIDTALESLQNTVGGWIEPYYPFEEPVCIVCNDEGKLLGLPLNRAIYNEDGQVIDVIAGPFFVCDCSGEDFASLSEEQLEKYTGLFELPQHFSRFRNEIVATPYLPRPAEYAR